MTLLGAARLRAPRALHLSLTAVVASASAAACYDYSASADPVARPASELRFTLTDLGSAELASQIGPRVESVDGRVHRATADTVVLAVTHTVARDGRETDWRGEPVTIATRQVATVRARRLSPTRTAIAAAVGVGAAVGVLLASRGSSSSGGIGNPIPPVGAQ